MRLTVVEALHLAAAFSRLRYSLSSDFPSQSFRRKLTHLKSSVLRLKTNMGSRVLSIDKLMDDYGFELPPRAQVFEIYEYPR